MTLKESFQSRLTAVHVTLLIRTSNLLYMLRMNQVEHAAFVKHSVLLVHFLIFPLSLIGRR